MKKVNDIRKIIEFKKVEDDLKVLEFADILLQGKPLCVDFSDCPEKYCNQILSFLSGVNYATDGDCKQLKSKIFLFALKEQFKDPQMKDFIKRWSEK